MIWGCMTAFGPGAWYKIKGRMDRHLYKSILENLSWFTIQNYNLDPSRLVFQHDCARMVGIRRFNSFNGMHNLHIWIPLNTSRHFSNGGWTNLRHLQEVSKNYGSLCGQCIPISMNMIAWCFMRVCHKESTLCWRVGDTGSSTKHFVGNLKKIEYLYIDSHLAFQHTFLLSM